VILALVTDRLLMLGARRCDGVVLRATTRRGMTGSPPYVPLIEHSATIRYVGQRGREHTFTQSRPHLPAVGETVAIRHRRRWPRLARIVP
jgi:uncharacterized membrane protein